MNTGSAPHPQAVGSAPVAAGPGNWNDRYLAGDTPWDQGVHSHNLERVLREWRVAPCSVLEMGCGTGSDAIYLARHGFTVTAFDVAPRAIEVAVQRAQQAGVQVQFLVSDFGHLPTPDRGYGLVFDSGFYHCVRKGSPGAIPEFVARMTQTGGLWLSVLGNANDPEPREKGPPRVRASELFSEIENLFAMVELRESWFESADKSLDWRPLAWSALMRRR